MPKQTRLSFIDWLLKNKVLENKVQCIEFIDKSLKDPGIHQGYCTNEKQTCGLCLLEGFLEEYSNYSESFFKENIYL